MRLTQRQLPNGVVCLRSPTLEGLQVPHAFTTRRGPANTEFDLRTLESDHVAALEAGLGEPKRAFQALRQVHGKTVLTVGSPLRDPLPAADALFSQSSTVWLCVRTADCVPILLAALDGSRVAAVHAGWRGLVKGVVEASSRHFQGAPIVAAIGPCLSAERFEVGPEVVHAFERADLATTIRAGAPRPHIDLQAAACLILQRLGAIEIDTTDRCTWTDAEHFHSHRRDVTHGLLTRAGHQAALITARG